MFINSSKAKLHRLMGCEYYPLHLCSECLLLLVCCLESIEAGISYWCCFMWSNLLSSVWWLCRLKGAMMEEVRQIFEAVFACTLEVCGYQIVLTSFMWRAFYTCVWEFHSQPLLRYQWWSGSWIWESFCWHVLCFVSCRWSLKTLRITQSIGWSFSLCCEQLQAIVSVLSSLCQAK